MNSIFTDAAMSDDSRRKNVYEGLLFVYRPCPASLAFYMDSQCTGTTMRDYLRGTDLEPIPVDVVAMYDRRRPQSARLNRVAAVCVISCHPA